MSIDCYLSLKIGKSDYYLPIHTSHKTLRFIYFVPVKGVMYNYYIYIIHSKGFLSPDQFLVKKLSPFFKNLGISIEIQISLLPPLFAGAPPLKSKIEILAKQHIKKYDFSRIEV